jgi:hypothetical protein
MPTLWMKNITDFCKDYNFKYTLWRESDLQSLWNSTHSELKKVYRKTLRKSGKCNILRLLILYNFGGIYIDADCVFLHPEKFTSFLTKNKEATFLSWETLTHEHISKFSKDTKKNSDMEGKKKIIANSIIGAKKGDPFIKLLLDEMPAFFKIHEGKGSWRESGPGYVANIYERAGSIADNVHVYPMSTFYPKGWLKITKDDQHLDYTKSKSLFFQYGYSTNNFHKIFRKTRKRRNV